MFFLQNSPFLMRQIRIFSFFFVTFCFLLFISVFAQEAKKGNTDQEWIIQAVRFLSEENHPRTRTKDNKEKTIDDIVKTITDAGRDVTRDEYAMKQFICDSDFSASSDHSPFWQEGYPALFSSNTAEFRNKTITRKPTLGIRLIMKGWPKPQLGSMELF